MIPTLDDMLDSACSVATESMSTRGSVKPQCLGHTQSNTIIAVPLTYEDDRQREIWISQVRGLFRRSGVVAYAMIFEAWASKFPASDMPPEEVVKRYEDNYDELRPSKDPQRVEVVSVMATDGRLVTGRCYEIVRDEAGKPRELKIFHEENATAVTMQHGEFANLLSDRRGE